jgi:hypothetical protein
MPDKNMNELQASHLEIAARAWANDKSREIAGITVDHVLTRTGATHFAPAVIQEAEAHMQRWLAAWLTHNLLEFTHLYMSDVEERAAQTEKLLNDVANKLPNPPFIKG